MDFVQICLNILIVAGAFVAVLSVVLVGLLIVVAIRVLWYLDDVKRNVNIAKSMVMSPVAGFMSLFKR